jgi:branched-chain amino acid aminotransferase
MLTISWSAASGWGQARIEPRHELAFDPLSGVLQYAVTCFEGMKVGLERQAIPKMGKVEMSAADEG